MSNETKRPQAAPKTIQVRTLVKAIIIVAVVAASFVLGWIGRSNADAVYNADVQNTAQALVTKLK